jgi:integral membrane protein
MSGALIRFRVMAYLVGCFLLLLTTGVVLRYGFGEPELSRTVSPIHGFLYLVYLVTVFDLGRRAAWPIKRMVLVMLAGTVPFLSFYAERVASRRWVPTPARAPVR